MQSNPKIKESDLAEKFIRFFSYGYNVYPEVPCQGVIDIIAFRDPVVIAVECKMQFGFDVLEQAIKNKAYAHYSYIAIPKAKIPLSALKQAICKQYGIGVLTYNFKEKATGKSAKSHLFKDVPEDEWIAGQIKEMVRPVLNRKISKPKLEEWMKKSVAGSQHERMTAFKYTVEEIEKLLQKKGSMKVDVALKRIKHHYGSLSSAKSSLSSLCKSNVIKSFYIEKGYFKLNEST